MSLLDNCTPPLVQGLTQQQLQARYNSLQQAILDLMSGAKAVSISYAQGDGAKSVTYSAANLADMQVTLRYLGAALGLNRPRRAIAVRF